MTKEVFSMKVEDSLPESKLTVYIQNTGLGTEPVKRSVRKFNFNGAGDEKI